MVKPSRSLCKLCQLTATKQREMAQDWASGIPYSTMAKTYGTTTRQLKRHFTRCVSGQAALAGWSSTVDYPFLIAHLQRSLEGIQETSAKWSETGGPWGAVEGSKRLTEMTDRLQALYNGIEDDRVEQLSCAVVDIASHYILDCPVSASEQIQSLLAQYPAARAALAEYEQDQKARNEQQDQDQTPDW